MRAAWMRIAIAFLIVKLLGFGQAAYAEMIQNKGETPSLSPTIIRGGGKQTEEAIQAEFRRLYERYGGGKENLPLVDKERYQKRAERLGFNDVSELKKVKVSRTNFLPITYIRLDHLREFNNSESEAKKILNKTDALIFPIEVSLEKRKFPSISQPFVVVVPAKKENPKQSPWRVIQSGPSKDFQLLFEARKELDKPIEGTCKCFVVWIPALKRYLLGDQSLGEFKIKILDNGLEELNLKKGSFLPANRVFSLLAKEAKNKKYEWPPWPFER